MDMGVSRVATALRRMVARGTVLCAGVAKCEMCETLSRTVRKYQSSGLYKSKGLGLRDTYLQTGENHTKKSFVIRILHLELLGLLNQESCIEDTREANNG